VTTLSVQRFATRSALDAALAERLRLALAGPGDSAVMLSGGTTPLPAYRALAAGALPHAAGLRILFTDERYVPANAEASNYHQTRPLLAALALPPDAVLRVRTELTLKEAAADYQRQLEVLVACGTPIGLGLLGLGADGHTCSLFAAADLERSAGRLAIPVHRPDGMDAVSVTPSLLSRVTDPIFVVAGQGKAEAVRALMAADPGLTAWRAVQGCERVRLWIA
jgi:6-phosphogluconolactonase